MLFLVRQEQQQSLQGHREQGTVSALLIGEVRFYEDDQ